LLAELLLSQMEVTVGSEDQQVMVTRLAVGGLLLAALSAIIGGVPFDLPMPTHLVNWVGPTCGLTRGSTAIARGDLGLAWRYNPASFAVMTFGVLGLVRVATGVLTGRWVNIRARIGPLGWVSVLIGVGLLGFHQQENAQFVMNARL